MIVFFEPEEVVPKIVKKEHFGVIGFGEGHDHGDFSAIEGEKLFDPEGDLSVVEQFEEVVEVELHVVEGFVEEPADAVLDCFVVDFEQVLGEVGFHLIDYFHDLFVADVTVADPQLKFVRPHVDRFALQYPVDDQGLWWASPHPDGLLVLLMGDRLGTGPLHSARRLSKWDVLVFCLNQLAHFLCVEEPAVQLVLALL